MKAPPLPGVMICCFSTVQRLPSCSITWPARIRFACCFIGESVAMDVVGRLLDPGEGGGQGRGVKVDGGIGRVWVEATSHVSGPAQRLRRTGHGARRPNPVP